MRSRPFARMRALPGAGDPTPAGAPRIRDRARGERPPHAAEGRDCPAQPRSRLPPEIASAILMMPNGLQSSRPPRFPGRRNRTATELPIALFAFSVIQCVFWLDFKRPFPCGSAAKVRRMRLRRAPECGFSGAAPPSVLANRWLAAYCHAGDGPGSVPDRPSGGRSPQGPAFPPALGGAASGRRGGAARESARLPSKCPTFCVHLHCRKEKGACDQAQPAGGERPLRRRGAPGLFKSNF